ncbi:DUF1904 domain-containing protein [Corallincola platygyrae]|uniref:DUF1904 domain-containing protein n=1 Tax=Corallincola platygyrae TaxID=1193278 RepID=A0ABW4XFY2_9GAMM
MPHLRFRGVEQSRLKEISKGLVDELSELLESGRDHFTLECIESAFVFDGANVKPEPMIEVLWFPRPQDTQDKFANIVTQALKQAGETQEIAVFFVTLTPSAYYDEGQHY